MPLHDPLRRPRGDVSPSTPRLLVMHRDSEDPFVHVLAQAELVELVGVASSAREGAQLMGDLKPDLVVFDLDDPELRREDTIRRLVGEGSIPAVGVTHDPDAPWIREAVRAGVTAIVRYSDQAVVLGDVLRLVAEVGRAPPRDSIES